MSDVKEVEETKEVKEVKEEVKEIKETKVEDKKEEKKKDEKKEVKKEDKKEDKESKVKKALIFKSIVAVKFDGVGDKLLNDRTTVTFVDYLGDNAIIMDYGIKYIVPKDAIILL